MDEVIFELNILLKNQAIYSKVKNFFKKGELAFIGKIEKIV